MLIVIQQLSCLFFVKHWLYTYAFLENVPWLHLIQLVQFLVGIVNLQTIQMIFDHDLSRRSPPTKTIVTKNELFVIGNLFNRPLELTFRRFIIVGGISLAHENLHFGQQCRAFQYLCIIDCNIEANGVTPIPVAINTACWARNI